MTADEAPPARRFAHEALFYAGDQGFVDGVAPFVREGVAQGEAVLVVVPARKIELLRDSLDGEATHVLFADMAEVGANPARIIPAWQDFVERNAGRQMRGVGEPISPDRGREELVECQRHEQLLNVAFATSPAWRLLCPYDTEALDPAVIDEALRSHPAVLEDGRCRPSESYLGLDEIGLPFGLPLLDPPAGAEPFAFDADSLAECRRRLYWQGTRAGLGVARTNDLVLAVNEILTNSVRHGGGTGRVADLAGRRDARLRGPRRRADRRPAGRPATPAARPDRRARPLDCEPALRPRPAALARGRQRRAGLDATRLKRLSVG